VTVSDLTETELVGRIQRCLPPDPPWLVVGIGDDAAVIEPERNRVEVVTVDALVDGVHFDRRLAPADAIGHRALAVNLSDLAAMGASPRAALLSLMLPPDLPLVDFDGLARGLCGLARRHGVALVGGNLTRTAGPLAIDVTAIGTMKRRDVMKRSGARPGDDVYVTGTVGGAAAGLQALTAGQQTVGVLERYLRPEPRLRMGMLLARNRAATACIDLSDGLADAVHQIADASGVGVRVDADALPLMPETLAWWQQSGMDPVTASLASDDYELLFAARPRLRGRMAAARRHGDVPMTRIGVCTAERDVVLRRGGRAEPMPRGYAHFAAAGAPGRHGSR